MFRSLRVLAVGVAFVSLASQYAIAQSVGSRGGLTESAGESGNADLFPALDLATAQRCITMEGVAQLRVAPTEIRVVLAVTHEGKTAQECQQAVNRTIDNLKGAWSKMGIAADHVVVDFIAVLPVYQWNVEKRGDVNTGVESRSGYRMQTNVHLAVANEATAQAAIGKAFELGITDIIAFDYWSRELDEAKVKTRELATQAARRKADTMLTALFDQRPPVINVQEQTRVRYPESLYHSFTNSDDESISGPWLRDIPLIHAYRPRNTYYQGLYRDSDVQPRELPMKPQITVISKVRIYFESPAAKNLPLKKLEKKGEKAAS